MFRGSATARTRRGPRRSCRGRRACRSRRSGSSARRSVVSFDARKDVIDVVVGTQGDLVQGACVNALDDFLAREVEDRLEDLRALLPVRLPLWPEEYRSRWTWLYPPPCRLWPGRLRTARGPPCAGSPPAVRSSLHGPARAGGGSRHGGVDRGCRRPRPSGVMPEPSVRRAASLCRPRAVFEPRRRWDSLSAGCHYDGKIP